MHYFYNQCYFQAILYFLSRLNARAFSDINCTYRFRVGITKNFTVNEFDSKWNSRKRSKGHRGLLALVAQRARKARQALTVACDVMARPSAVHTLRTRLAAAMPVEPWRADCSRQSVAGEERESVDNIGWNKGYIIMKQGMTRVIKGVQKNQGRMN